MYTVALFLDVRIANFKISHKLELLTLTGILNIPGYNNFFPLTCFISLLWLMYRKVTRSVNIGVYKNQHNLSSYYIVFPDLSDIAHNIEDPIIKFGTYGYNIHQYFSKNRFDSPWDCKLDPDLILYQRW